jgi:hypothetical protein
MRKGVSPFLASIILTSLSIVIIGVLLIWGKGLVISLKAGVEKEKNLTLSFEAPRIVGIKANEVFIISDYPVPSEYTVRKFYLDTRELEILSKTSGDVIKLQLNETIPIGKQILRFITNTGRLWRQEFNVPNNWALSDFTERKGIVIDNTHSLPLTNYQISIDPKLTITDGLVFHAHMGDEGNLVIDYSGNNNDGKLYGNTRALFKFDEGLDNKTFDSSSYANNGIFYGGNDGTIYGQTNSNTTVLYLTGSSPISLDHYIPGYKPEKAATLVVYYINNTPNLAYNTVNVYVNGNSVGSFNDAGETSVQTKSFSVNPAYLLDGNNKITYSGNVTNITRSDLILDPWVNGKFGKALRFDGSNDYVSVPTKPSLDFTEPFTLVAWTFLKEDPAIRWVRMQILGKGRPFNMNTMNDGRICFQHREGAAWIDYCASEKLPLNRWAFVAIVRDNLGNLTIYLDGKKLASWTGVPHAQLDTNTNVFIGSAYGSSNFFNGTIDEIRIYTRALSGPTTNCTIEPNNEICELYESTSDFNTTLNDTGLVLYLRFNEGSGTKAKDDSMWRINPNNCISNSCLNFDGNDGKGVVVPYSSTLNLTKVVTVAAWAKPTLGTANDAFFIAGRGRSSYEQYGLWIWTDANKNGRAGICYNGVTAFRCLQTDYIITIPNIWYHLVGIIDWENNKMEVWLNGELKASSTIPEAAASTPADELSIGAFRGNPDYPPTSTNGMYFAFNGTIDEVAIYSKALSSEEIKALYEAKKAKFVEYKQGKLSKAIEFDGIDDYVDLGNPTSLNPDYITITAWFYNRGNYNESENHGSIITKYDDASGNYRSYSLGIGRNPNPTYQTPGFGLSSDGTWEGCAGNKSLCVNAPTNVIDYTNK